MSEQQKKKRKKLSRRRKEEIVDMELEDGAVEEYTVKELLGPDRDVYMNLMNSRFILDANGNPTGIKDVSGMQAKLLCMTVFDCHGKQFTEDEINKWPAQTQNELSTIAIELSGLNKKAEEEAKNGSLVSG